MCPRYIGLEKEIMHAYKSKNISNEQLLLLNDELKTMANVCGGCERIKNTPIPYSYSMFLKKFIFSTEMATSVYTSNAESKDITAEDEQIQKLIGNFYQRFHFLILINPPWLLCKRHIQNVLRKPIRQAYRRRDFLNLSWC